nr:Putative antirestriction protein [Escherichia coli O25b:H4-ST131]
MQYAKPVTLNVEECDHPFCLTCLATIFCMTRRMYALAKNDAGVSGGFWHFIRLPDGGGYMMPDGDRFPYGERFKLV